VCSEDNDEKRNVIRLFLLLSVHTILSHVLCAQSSSNTTEPAITFLPVLLCILESMVHTLQQVANMQLGRFSLFRHAKELASCKTFWVAPRRNPTSFASLVSFQFAGNYKSIIPHEQTLNVTFLVKGCLLHQLAATVTLNLAPMIET
jgi:hypothetical protein